MLPTQSLSLALVLTTSAIWFLSVPMSVTLFFISFLPASTLVVTAEGAGTRRWILLWSLDIVSVLVLVLVSVHIDGHSIEAGTKSLDLHSATCAFFSSDVHIDGHSTSSRHLVSRLRLCPCTSSHQCPHRWPQHQKQALRALDLVSAP